jgi:nitrogen-specific signal transduction histidine kinase/putative methionine-R-sulfoxide reductase with GAF domain
MQDCKIFLDSKNYELSKSFLNGTLKQMLKSLKAECGSLFLFDDETNELVLNNFYNSQPLAIKGLRRKAGQGICGKVFRLRQPVLVKDIDRDIRFHSNGFKHYRTGSFMAIPLFVYGNPFGLINIGDKANGKPFSEQDLDFCVTLAKYGCTIIENLLFSSKIRQENERLFQEKSLLEKYASVGKMASGIVHEISNPLDGVIRFSNMLTGQMERDPRFSGYLSGIKEGLARLRDITLSLCNFGRQFKNVPGQELIKTDVNKLLEDSLAIFQDRISGRIRIKRVYRKRLPKVADQGLQQVFINLIKNALDAMSGTGELEVRTGLSKNCLLIVIKDSGHGILPEVREHIFEPFFTTKGQEKGAGLGLSICKEIVNRYQGQILVRSKPGKGTDFYVSIPIQGGEK